MVVTTGDWKGHLHAKNTKQSGVNMQRTANTIIKLESTGCYNTLGRIVLGSQITEDQILNNMMIQMQNHEKQVDSIVLKLLLHLVVLLLLGHTFLSQNHQQIF